MGLPVKEVIDGVDHALTALNLLAPLAKSIASYIGGATDEMPAQVPDHLRSEVELARLKARSTRSEPPVTP